MTDKKKPPDPTRKFKEKEPGPGPNLLKPFSRDDFSGLAGRKETEQMYYIKDHRGRNIDLDSLRIYNLCPRCGAETRIDGFWDLLGDGQLELYGSSVHCKRCTQHIIHSGKGIFLE
jgi:hypothetical protein